MNNKKEIHSKEQPICYICEKPVDPDNEHKICKHIERINKKLGFNLGIDNKDKDDLNNDIKYIITDSKKENEETNKIFDKKINSVKMFIDSIEVKGVKFNENIDYKKLVNEIIRANVNIGGYLLHSEQHTLPLLQKTREILIECINFIEKELAYNVMDIFMLNSQYCEDKTKNYKDKVEIIFGGLNIYPFTDKNIKNIILGYCKLDIDLNIEANVKKHNNEQLEFFELKVLNENIPISNNTCKIINIILNNIYNINTHIKKNIFKRIDIYVHNDNIIKARHQFYIYDQNSIKTRNDEGDIIIKNFTKEYKKFIRYDLYEKLKVFPSNELNMHGTKICEISKKINTNKLNIQQLQSYIVHKNIFYNFGIDFLKNSKKEADENIDKYRDFDCYKIDNIHLYFVKTKPITLFENVDYNYSSNSIVLSIFIREVTYEELSRINSNNNNLLKEELLSKNNS